MKTWANHTKKANVEMRISAEVIVRECYNSYTIAKKELSADIDPGFTTLVSPIDSANRLRVIGTELIEEVADRIASIPFEELVEEEKKT